MKIGFSDYLKFSLLTWFCIALNSLSAQTSLTYSFSGVTQTFVVPTCVNNLSVSLRGAQGGNNTQPGGYGGFVFGVITVTPGQILYINVGEQNNSTLGVGGYNGGGNGGVSSLAVGRGGGGATDIRTGGLALSNRIMVAGGGGGSSGNPNTSIQTGGYGGAGNTCSSPFGVGGGGGFGGTNGGAGGCSGGTAVNYATGGAGGGLNSGGSLSGAGNGGFGQAGSIGQGGNGGDYAATYGGTVGSIYGGGGGGGGYYGGAGAMGAGAATGGGGGGSSYANNSLISNISFSSSNTYTGHGWAIISYSVTNPVSISSTTAAICIGSSYSISAYSGNSYTWSTGANTASIAVTPTSNSSYTVTSTNSIGCLSSAVCNVTVNTSSPILSVNTSSNQICLGGTVSVIANGASTYSWSNGIVNGQVFTPTATASYSVTGINGCGSSTAITSVSVIPLPVTIAGSSSVICEGSLVTLNAITQGTAYNWQPTGATTQSISLIPVASTVYTLNVSSGICIGSATYSLNVLAAPSISASSSAFSVCAGQSLTLNAGGASSYTWNPGAYTSASIIINPTASIQYSVIGTNSNNCSGNSLVTVSVQPNPYLTIFTSGNLICKGSTATIIASGGNTYLWNSGNTSPTLVVSPSVSTVYSVIATNSLSGCTASAPVTIDVFNPPISVSGNSIICNGSSATISATGANSYTWSNGAPFSGITVTPTLTTTFSVTTISNSLSATCLKVIPFTVTVNPNPTLVALPDRSIVCNGESVEYTVTGANSYTWSNQTYSSTTTVFQLQNGINTITVTGMNNYGCYSSLPISVTVNACTKISEFTNLENKLKVYPNPSSGKVFILCASNLPIVIKNELGETILSFDNFNFNHSIENLAPGIYFVECIGNNTNNAKFIILGK